jgi:hypothetical protein
MNWLIDITVIPIGAAGISRTESGPEALQYMYRKSFAKPKWPQIAAEIERKIIR